MVTTSQLPPSRVAILQATGWLSDKGAVQTPLFDRRWRMILDCQGAQSAPFCRGLLVDHRRQLSSKIFRHQLTEPLVMAAKPPELIHKASVMTKDSAPLWAAARVQDTRCVVTTGWPLLRLQRLSTKRARRALVRTCL